MPMQALSIIRGISSIPFLVSGWYTLRGDPHMGDDKSAQVCQGLLELA